MLDIKSGHQHTNCSKRKLKSARISNILSLYILYYIILYYIISYYIILYHIILYHIILYYIILYYIISYYIISYYMISYYIILYHIILFYIILYYIILYHIISYYIISYHIILYYIIYICIYDLFFLPDSDKKAVHCLWLPGFPPSRLQVRTSPFGARLIDCKAVIQPDCSPKGPMNRSNTTRWCPQDSVQLVQITPTMVYR